MYFEEKISDEHYESVMDLINYNAGAADEEFFEVNEEIEDTIDDSDDYVVEDIGIGKAQFNTKCFELFYENGETEFISYRLKITKSKVNLFDDFRKAARNTINDDIRAVKQAYFDEFSKQGLVPCQETGIYSKWTDLVVDHRQPNTFSMIVDRFLELNNIDLSKVDYVIGDNNFILFDDSALSKDFRNYHKEKATLRIVRKERNLSRAYQGRIKEQKKDLKIKN